MPITTPFQIIAALLGCAGILAFLGAPLARLMRRVTMLLLAAAIVFGILDMSRQSFGPAGDMCFLLMTSVVGLFASWHAGGCLKGASDGYLRCFWGFLDWMLCAMYLVVEITIPRVGFLAAWEVMGLCSCALVLLEHHATTVRRAGWLYLLLCEAGGLLLLLGLFAYPDINPYVSAEDMPRAQQFLLLLGFGLKAGFPLLHFWLPEDHPSSPAPVSAIMSGAMLPLGFFGFFTYVSQYSPYFCVGATLLALGVAGAVFGILSGARSRNINRLLAYSNIWNMGVAAIGFGLGMLGYGMTDVEMGIFGFAGGFLHLLIHALHKGAQFLAAGAILKSTGTPDMGRLGGLMKRMPLTGACFALTSLGICGLPPFSGFAGELLIYVAAFTGIVHSALDGIQALSLVAVLALALTGVAAFAAFASSASSIFQGEAAPEETTMTRPIVLLSALALLAPFMLPFINFRDDAIAATLTTYAVVSGAFHVVAGVLLYRCRRVGIAPRQFMERMLRTVVAVFQPLADKFKPFLKKPWRRVPEITAAAARLQESARRFVCPPIVRTLHSSAIPVHRLQAGYIQLYVLLVAAALLLLLGFGFHE